MSARCRMIRIPLILRQHNIWLGSHRIWLLIPKKRNGTTHLHKGAYFWLQIKLQIINIAYLLDFYKIGNIAFLINTSFQVPSTCISPRSSWNQNKSAILTINLKVQLIDIAINNGHDPQLFNQYAIKLLNKIMVPKKMGLERLMFSQYLLSYSVFWHINFEVLNLFFILTVFF